MALEKSDDAIEELDFIDPDTAYMFGKNEVTFNHEVLVMRAYVKVQDCLAKEMVEGFWEQKMDKFGNILSIYHPDTRREAIEAISTLKNTMVADIEGTSYGAKIKELQENLKQKFKDTLKGQLAWWEKFKQTEKEIYLRTNRGFSPYVLNDESPFYHQYLYEKVEVFREILEQLELCLAKEKAYFKRKMVSA